MGVRAEFGGVGGMGMLWGGGGGWREIFYSYRLWVG